MSAYRLRKVVPQKLNVGYFELPLTFIDTCEYLQRPAMDVSTVEGGWCVSARQQWVTSAGAGFCVHGMQALAHYW